MRLNSPKTTEHAQMAQARPTTDTATAVRKGWARRQVLHRMLGGALSLVGTVGVAGCSHMKPAAQPTSTRTPSPTNLTGIFGKPLDVGLKSQFPPALPQEARLGSQGVFYLALAQAYLIHLSAETSWLVRGAPLVQLLASESWVQDADGTYWAALYQKCVHMGCKVPFRDDCQSFECPCHGAHYAVDGEYLDGPAPRSLDRFALSFQGEHVIIDTGRLNSMVERPGDHNRLLPIQGTTCSGAS